MGPPTDARRPRLLVPNSRFVLTSYAIADPAVGQPAGTWANAGVQKLYDQWKARGLTSVQDAYAVGVALERADIADLQGMLGRTSEADVQRVFARLLDGSQHHLEVMAPGWEPGTGWATATVDHDDETIALRLDKRGRSSGSWGVYLASGVRSSRTWAAVGTRPDSTSFSSTTRAGVAITP